MSVDRSELPPGWIDAKLAEVARWGSGGTPSRSRKAYFGGKIPWIKTGELGPKFILRSEEKITQDAVDNSSAKIFPKGAVALAMYGATIGKASILGVDAATNQACAVGVPDGRLISSEYLYFYLVSQQRKFVEQGQGGAQPNISQGIVKGWPIPLAPRAEQDRITAKVGNLIEAIARCRARLNRAPDLLRRFREAVLEAAVSGRLTEAWRSGADTVATQEVRFDDALLRMPGSWNVSPLSALINESRPLCYGVVQPGGESRSGVALIRIQDLAGGAIRTTDLRTISPEINEEYRRSRVEGGDLLVSVVGTIGRTAIVPPDLTANIARAIARIACRSGVDPRWVKLWLDSPTLQWWLTKSAREVARKTLNLSELGKIVVGVPSEGEQAEIVRRAETLLSIADSIEEQVRFAQASANTVILAILAKAFRGELVAQDPRDEPATEMQERMAAGHEVAEPSEFQRLGSVHGRGRRKQAVVAGMEGRGRKRA